MRKVITFLGKYPKETRYSFKGKIYKGQVFPEALRQFLDFDEMLVLVTEEARAQSFPVLAALQDERILPVDIPTGETTKEMWEIFYCILNQIEENDTVIFDITHGLRSIPFLVFLFAAFLKYAQKVKIEAVYYGAFELGNAKEGIPAPVIEMTEFVGMLDWLAATDRFVDLGDGRALAQLLRNEAPPGIERKDNLQKRKLGTQLEKSADAIEGISLALRLARPLETMEKAAELEQTLNEASETLESEAPPFEVLTDQVENAYKQFGLKNPEKPENVVKNLEKQLRMIHWYIEHDQIIQAVTLAREWIISVLICYFDGKYIFDKASRDQMNAALNYIVDIKRPKDARKNISPNNYSAALEKKLPQDAGDIAGLWDKLANTRNDIAHVGMREHQKSVKKLTTDMEGYFRRLEKLGMVLLGIEE